jgi:hypothetical protein
MRERRIKRFGERPKGPNLEEFAPVGTKDCEMKCDRDVLMTKEGPVIVCKGCMRIVMDNRDK